MKILASEQVQTWLAALPPEAKRRVRVALRKLEKGKGDILALRGELAGFNRLRVGGVRVIYSQHPGLVLRLQYAETRDTVYENFLEVLARRRSE